MTSELDFGDQVKDSDSESEKSSREKRLEELQQKKKLMSKHITEDKVCQLRSEIMDEKSYLKYLLINVSNYNFKNWSECFPNNKVYLKPLITGKSWFEFFDSISSKNFFREIEIYLSSCLKEEQKVVPYPELVFNAFNVLPLDKVRVVFLGQDPYINSMTVDNKCIPQATGFSFSVPSGYPKPPSLSNINKNLVDFSHITKISESGCLISWIMQGCLMVNSAFTTIMGESAAHQRIWAPFAQALISYLNTKCKNLVFVAWGKKAYELCQDVDQDKHCLIVSSHPSGYSYQQPMSAFSIKKRTQLNFDAFVSVDHFGRINRYLESKKKAKIYWGDIGDHLSI